MAFDIIVYKQEALENALGAGYTSIALCDNSFNLPLYSGISYTAIGDVSAFIDISEEEYNGLGINCTGFSPVFLGKTTDSIHISLNTASVSSYVSSYMMSSYFLTSFTTSYVYKYISSFTSSYIYEYEYEYAVSFFTSYMTSFASSYSTSFLLDMLCFEGDERREEKEECILVNGYGINLI